MPRPLNTCRRCDRPAQSHPSGDGLCWRCRRRLSHAPKYLTLGGLARSVPAAMDPGRAKRIRLYQRRAAKGLPLFA